MLMVQFIVFEGVSECLLNVFFLISKMCVCACVHVYVCACVHHNTPLEVRRIFRGVKTFLPPCRSWDRTRSSGVTTSTFTH